MERIVRYFYPKTVLIDRQMIESLFAFADNEPEDPETVFYTTPNPSTEQSELREFEED